MRGEPTHLLTKMGILASFSIATKLTEREINSMARRFGKKTKNQRKIIALVKEKIMKDIIDASLKGNLPGILLEEITPIPLQNVKMLDKMVALFSSKLKTKKLDKLSLCYFINYLVGNLGLTEEDFENFHRKINETQETDEEETDEEE